MSSPLKPWERQNTRNSRSLYPGVNHTLGPRNGEFKKSQSGSGFVAPSPRHMASGPAQNTRSKDFLNPPQVPPRPNTQRLGYRSYSSPTLGGYGSYGSYGSYGNFGSPYGMYGGSYGIGGYGSFPSYSSFNRIGYGGGNMPTASFVRRAEETSRPAFESIESIVQAFGSIAMMLESTFFAVHSSFRAVLGVADQFSLLKQHIINTLGALTVFRAIRYVFRKLLVLLRLRKPSSAEDELWSEAAKSATESNVKATRSWPIVMFFAVVLGTPWLIWKFLLAVGGESNDTPESWMTGEGEHFVAQAEFDFDAENDDELSFREGDILRVAPKGKQPSVRGWLLATVDGKREGIVPANHVKVLGRRMGSNKRSDNKVRFQLINEEDEEVNDAEGQSQESNTELGDVFDDFNKKDDTTTTSAPDITESNVKEDDES